MVIVVMGYGENMPGSKKLIDILDEMNLKENEILNKMGRLLRLIESTNPSIDDPELLEEANEKFKPVISKINMVLAMAEAKQDKGVPFVKNILEYVKTNYHITKKQMTALNKVYKRVSEDLFEEKNNG